LVENIPEGYKRTEVGIVPKDWVVDEVQDAYSICNNLRLPISEQVRKGMQGKYPYYGPTKIQDYINQYRLDGEYALIGEDGDHFLKWATMPMTLLAAGKFNVNNHAHVIQGTKNETKWFYWYFYNKDITPVLSRQGAGRYKLNKATLKSIKMPIPPRAEQTAIANVLLDIDGLISSLTKLICKKRNIKLGAMQVLLTGKKRLDRFKGEWENINLVSQVNVFSGGTPKSDNSDYYGGNIPWITSSDLNKKYIYSVDHHITELGLKNSSAKIIKEDTLLIALYGATAGVTAISKIQATINQAVLAISSDNINTKFLFYWFNLKKDYIISTFTQGGQPNLSGAIIKALNVYMPVDVEEQVAIVEILSDIDNEIEKLNQKLIKYKEIKQGMMQELLTGKRRLI
jgi:type I restriction enzyme S subunit